MTKIERCQILVLVKALPQPSKKYRETVCCAGVTRGHEWKRLFPIRFRHLSEDTKFKRWQWIEYDWRRPKSDPRAESQSVLEESITSDKFMPTRDRANFLSRIIYSSLKEVETAGQTLALIRPRKCRFRWKRKSRDQIERERDAYKEVARQPDFFDHDLQALEPCPYDFRFTWESTTDSHNHSCADWEIAAMFRKFRSRYGEKAALEKMNTTFNDLYPANGMAFALGTHSRYPKSWLLVGVIRVDDNRQIPLL